MTTGPLPSTPIRTRFAPSPTGFIHLGNIRSALYPWVFARKMRGTFILRIEDTDIERSTDACANAVLEALEWLGLDIDEGPFYQRQRMERYREVIAQLLAQGQAYLCYLSSDALDAMRNAARARGETPRYDGRWRPEPGKTLPAPPPGITPVVRFKNPLTGSVSWDDAVKGRIEIANETLDDLVIARTDGSPTYNFCAVVDDLDMRMTHVIRGDDHINNTPRQINIWRALGATPPIYAHLPAILDERGEKMSKRRGALSVIDYRRQGYLPEAMLNYLARLGWAHGDHEIFSRDQLIEWFDFKQIGQSPAQHNPKKLKWLNHHYIQHTDNARLAALTQPFLRSILPTSHAFLDKASQDRLSRIVALFKTRANTLAELAEQAAIFYRPPPLSSPSSSSIDALRNCLTEPVCAALAALTRALRRVEWQRDQIHAAFDAVLQAHQLKLPQLAMPVRWLVTGTAHTPAIDAVLELFDRNTVIDRIEAGARG